MRKLPVGLAVENCLRSVLAYSPEAAKIGVPWIVVGIVVAIVQGILLPADFFDPEAMALGASAGDFRPYLVLFVDILAYLFALSSIAVNWHRFALIDEMPTKFKRLRIDRLTIRYFGNLLLTIVIALVPAIAFGFVVFTLADRYPTESFAFDIIAIGGSVLILAVVSFMFSILTLRLPAIALNDQKIGLLNTLNFVTGNYLGIMGYAISVSACLWFISFAADLVDRLILPYGGVVGGIISFVMQIALIWFSLMVGIASITTLYGYFVEKRDFEETSAD